MKQRTRNLGIGILLVIGGFVAGCLLFLGFRALASQMLPYGLKETTDIAQYGIYTGTPHDDVVSSQITSFFPETIEESFTEVNYSFKTTNLGGYAYEAYLEFVIEDPDLFAEHISKIGDVQWKPFSVDSSYLEYNLSDEMNLSFESALSTDEESVYIFTGTDFRKILYNPDEQRMIYVAIGVFGSGATTKDFRVFFERFDTDAVEFRTGDGSNRT